MVGQGPILLLVETHPELRKLIREYLDRRVGVPVAEATTAVEALAKARRWKPAIILTDLSVPDELGVDFFRMLRSACPEACIVAMGCHPESVYLDALDGMRGPLWARLGVSAYVSKETLVSELAPTLWRIMPDRKLTWPHRLAWRERMVRESLLRPLTRRLAVATALPARTIRWLDENAWPSQRRPRLLYLANVVGWLWVLALGSS